MKLRMRDMREDRDLTQQQIADYLRCDQSLYSKNMNAENGTFLFILLKACVVL